MRTQLAKIKLFLRHRGHFEHFKTISLQPLRVGVIRRGLLLSSKTFLILEFLRPKVHLILKDCQNCSLYPVWVISRNASLYKYLLQKFTQSSATLQCLYVLYLGSLGHYFRFFSNSHYYLLAVCYIHLLQFTFLFLINATFQIKTTTFKTNIKICPDLSITFFFNL